MNLLWIDCETTGLDANKHDVIQIACIPVVNGVRQPSFMEYGQPKFWENIQAKAVEIHGITVEQMKTFQPQEDLLENFIEYIRSFGVKFGVAGHNVGFDKKMMSGLFSRYGRNNDFFQLFNLNVHDTLYRARKIKTKLKTENHKLETLCKHFDIEIQAHDALSDISGNIELDVHISELMGEDTQVYTPAVNVNDIVVSEDLPQPAQLHLHSQYTMFDAVPTPEEWSDWCIENNIPGFSVVDQGYAISLYDAAGHDNEETVCVPGVGLNFKMDMDADEHYHLNAWAYSKEGYFNLMKLASIGWETPIDCDKREIPVVSFQQILDHREGLRFGTADIDGYIGKAVQHGQKDFAEFRYQTLCQHLGDSLYVEFNPVDITHTFDKKIGFRKVEKNCFVTEGNIQKAYNNFLFDMVEQHGGKPIPVSGACFIKKEDKILQDCLCKNGHKDSKYYQESYHAKTAADLYRELRVHLGERFTEDRFRSWVQNSLSVMEGADKIEIKHEYHLPAVDIPEHIRAKTDDYDQQTYLLTLEKIKEHGRWNDSDEYKERFMREIDVIWKNKAMNFLPYFLMYEDFGRYAREQGFLQNIARGSAGGCLLSYYLKIIHVDPIAKDLPFERFLSHARINAGSWPDIDMDISKTARPYLMKYMQEVYGTGFAQVATYSTMKTKNAIKDAMWALYGRNRNDFEVDAVCKTIPDSPQGIKEKDFLYGYDDKEGVHHKGQLEINEHLQNFFNTYPDIAAMVKKLIGVVRGLSRHASAFVISTLDLPGERLPTLQMFDKGVGGRIPVTQYEASMCESVGLVKADVLGLKTLQVVTDAIKLVNVDYLESDENGVNLIYRLPEDEAVYADFYNKKTDSSFQFNSGVIKACLQDYVPTCREDLSALTALKRPGAMDAEVEDGIMADKWYEDVRQGKRKMKLIHPDLAPIIGQSNGIFVYQEQVMKCLVDICGYTLEETDQVRSAIAKKKQDVMMATFDKIRENTAARGWPSEQADSLCQTILAFSRYSFNRSHSYAYAEMGYITMYLKRHHRLEWWASVLNNEDNEDKLRHYISLLGDLVKPPSMKNPMKRFTIKDGHIIAPVSVVKGVGPKAYQELTEKGPFSSLMDYVSRVDHRKVDIGVVSRLIMARAADDFMDLDNLDYVTARFRFMRDYKVERGNIKSNFKPELESKDPLEMFLMERTANKTFNKSVLTDAELLNDITSAWKGFKRTGHKGIPLMLGEVPVLTNANIAAGFLDKKHEKEIGMILLYEGSIVRKGTSKRTGRPYCFLSIQLSDGFTNIEATDWNKTSSLRYPKNSLVYVRATLKPGWKTSVCLNIQEIELIK